MTGWTILWIVALIVFVIAEISTLQLISIWFAAGSFAALIMAAFSLPWWSQIIVFVVTSTVLVICTRPIVTKMQKKIVPTNSELDVGRKAIVTEDIDNEKNAGRVNLDGIFWAARSSENRTFSKGETVIVDKVDGAKLFVSAEKNNIE